MLQLSAGWKSKDRIESGPLSFGGDTGDQTRRPDHLKWYDVEKDGTKVGSMTNGVVSPRFDTTIGYLLVSTAVMPGDRVEILRDRRRDAGTVSDILFYRDRSTFRKWATRPSVWQLQWKRPATR